MPRLFLLFCLTLAACGADGPPEPPTRAAMPQDVAVEGSPG
jgi:predicted small lipoprotein YifL